MIDRLDGFSRMRTLQIVVLIIFCALILRVGYLQLVDTKYEQMAKRNAIRSVVQYPARGEIFDRNGEPLVLSRASYDLTVTRRDMDKDGFDTVELCRIIGIEREKLDQKLELARRTPRIPILIDNHISGETKVRFDELQLQGFNMVYRTIREYPRSIGGNLLGYISEITAEQLRRDTTYRPGEYVGMMGIERAYEQDLRGVKGVKVLEVNTHGEIKGSYQNGEIDSLPVTGRYMISTIDAELQLFAEELLGDKVGAAVAIEPSTGEILMMVSSPTYDPENLVGKARSKNYAGLALNRRRPMYNRAVASRYPPGSTFKLIQGLIGLQEGTLKPSYKYSCNHGYTSGGLHVGCHAHGSPLDLDHAVATSCNAYFCNVFRNILDNPKYGSVKEGYDKWEQYVRSFGLGSSLNTDFLGEGRGSVPTRSYYDRVYRGSWNSLTVVSLSIGQGELGLTPLQMANVGAILANRGYYYTPHIIRSVEGKDSLDSRFYERHHTMIDSHYFEDVIRGMSMTESGDRNLASFGDVTVCGKTGTAENPHGRDHSTFMSFSPRENPKIAISVYVENGGFGATTARPIASLLQEFYLTRKISRPELVRYIKDMKIAYPAYDK